MAGERAQRARRAPWRGRTAALAAAAAVLVTVLLLAGRAPADAPPDAQAVARADAAQRTLVRDFGGRGRDGVFALRAPAAPGDPGAVMYWWQAQALDVLIDRQEREPTAAGRARIARLIDSIRRANGDRLTRGYNDDMAWMALALLRAEGLGLDTSGDVRALWRRIRRGWNDAEGGGISWSRFQPAYKNLPANGPAAILAARLYARDHRPADLDWAKQIVGYIHRRLIDRQGHVIDGINRQGDGRADLDWDFSYDVGVAVGADLALAQVTHDAALRRHALWVARANLPVIAPDGILRDEGGGDAALFRGIAARYLAELGDAEIDAVLRRSAAALWANRNAAGRFGDSWTQPAPGRTDLGAQISGTMLLEQIIRLRS